MPRPTDSEHRTAAAPARPAGGPQITRTILLREPQAAANEVSFGWRVEPSTELYARQSFYLRFPPEVALERVPADLWWTVALICLHNHWALLRPCRVELPVELPPGEREFWLRLLDAAVETLELTWGGGNRGRTIEIRDRGPRLRPQAGGGDAIATAFSGGKDSLLQLGLLLELGERPLAVTTTSPMPPLLDHDSPRRRAALDAVAAHPAVEHVEVRSNFRECWDNGFARARGYELSVNELSDTMLYLAVALIVGRARGAGRVLLASEAEVQATAVRDAALVQHPHFMYSAVTQRSLDRLLARHGMGYGSITYPLRAWQVARLLFERYPRLAELQYSCWRHEPGAGACSGCPDCLANGLAGLQAGVGPARLGIDVSRLLERMHGWEPKVDQDPAALPAAQVRRELHGATVRRLAAMRTRRFAMRLARTEPRRLLRRDALETLRRYAWLRGRLAPQATAVPAPGYRHAYLALVDARWRAPLERLFDAEFERAPESDDATDLAGAEALIEHITEPLGAAA